MADRLIEGPISGNFPKTPSTKPSGSHVVNGEPGYQKRKGGRFDEVTKDLGNRLEKPTKR